MSPFLRPELADLSIPDEEREALTTCPVGTKIHFEEERHGYTVQARDERFLVCTKPFNPRHTVLYTIVDLEKLIRGPENLVFGMGAETREQCEDMLERLNGQDRDAGFATEISWRTRIALKVRKVSPPAEASHA